VYPVSRENAQPWEPKADALKIYIAVSEKLNTGDETRAEGTAQNDDVNETLGSVHILRDGVVYTKQWNASYLSAYRLANERMGIYASKTSGSEKQTLRDFDVGSNGYFNSRTTVPNRIYFGVYRTAGES